MNQSRERMRRHRERAKASHTTDATLQGPASEEAKASQEANAKDVTPVASKEGQASHTTDAKNVTEVEAIRELLPPGCSERDVYLYVVAQRLEREHPGLLDGLKRGFGGKQIRDLDTGAMLPLAHQVRLGVYGPRLSEMLALRAYKVRECV